MDFVSRFNMDSVKKIRHFLLNILVLMNIDLSYREGDEDCGPVGELRDFLRLAGLILSYEQFILEGRLNFFRQDSSLESLLKCAIGAYEPEIKKQKVEVKHIGEDLIVDVDKQITIDALKCILGRVIVGARVVELIIDKAKYSLMVRHDGRDLADCSKRQILDMLSLSEFGAREIQYQLGMDVLEAAGLKIEFAKDSLKIYFQ